MSVFLCHPLPRRFGIRRERRRQPRTQRRSRCQDCPTPDTQQPQVRHKRCFRGHVNDAAVYLDQGAVIKVQQRPPQARVGLHQPPALDCAALDANHRLGLVALASSPGRYADAAVLGKGLQSRKAVTELTLQTQLRPGLCTHPQGDPLTLQLRVYRGCPESTRVHGDGAIQMSLDWTQHHRDYDQWRACCFFFRTGFPHIIKGLLMRLLMLSYCYL